MHPKTPGLCGVSLEAVPMYPRLPRSASANYERRVRFREPLTPLKTPGVGVPIDHAWQSPAAFLPHPSFGRAPLCIHVVCSAETHLFWERRISVSQNNFAPRMVYRCVLHL